MEMGQEFIIINELRKQSRLTIDYLTVILCEAKVRRVVHQRVDLIMANVDAQAGQGAHLIQVVEIEVA